MGWSLSRARCAVDIYPRQVPDQHGKQNWDAQVRSTWLFTHAGDPNKAMCCRHRPTRCLPKGELAVLVSPCLAVTLCADAVAGHHLDRQPWGRDGSRRSSRTVDCALLSSDQRSQITDQRSEQKRDPTAFVWPSRMCRRARGGRAVRCCVHLSPARDTLHRQSVSQDVPCSAPWCRWGKSSPALCVASPPPSRRSTAT
jgi:hypothetical protein